MVFQKRNREATETKDGKSKMSEKTNKRTASKSDTLKSTKQVKEEPKSSLEESSVSSEDLSNDMMPVNRTSDDSEAGESSGSGNSSNGSSPNMSSSKKTNMAKIPFEPGLRLEAKDLGNEIWYAVKVVEVDWEEEEILIHFEKWSQRYDEWISMDSSRLRTIQEATGSKSGKKSSKPFKVGDRVNATWSDSRKYPATVKTLLPGDKYEVLFMDGYTKVIKGTRMDKLKESDMLNAEEFDPEKLGVFKVPEKPPAPPVLSPLITDPETIGTKAERRERKRKLNVAELFHVKKRSRRSPSSSPAGKVSDPEAVKEVDAKPPDEEPESAPQEDADMEDVKPLINESDIKSEPVEENTKTEEAEVKVRRKITPKVRDGEEDDVKPRRRIKRESMGGRPSRRAGGFTGRLSRKLARKRQRDDKEQADSTDTAAVPGTSQEGTSSETPKTKKRESREGEGEKPEKSTRRSALETWEPEGEPAYVVESVDGLRKSIIVPDKRLPEGWIKHMIQRKGGHSAGKWDVFFMCPNRRKFRSRHELRNYFEERGEVFPREQFDFSLGRRKMRWTSQDSSSKTSSASVPGRSGVGRGKLAAPALPEEQPIRRVKTLLPKIRIPQPEDGTATTPESSCSRSPLPPYTTTVTTTPAARVPDDASEGGVLVGSLKIQMENDAYMCPKDGCNKHFRKENLLQMHIKHYHPEYNKFMGSTPNVADLAYARTIGEPVEDLIPKARYSVASPTFLEKINRFEANRKAKSLGSSLSPGGPSTSTAPDLKKLPVKDKPGVVVASKKIVKGELDTTSSESSLAAEDSMQEDNPPVLEPVTKEETTTIKTLLPVVRTAAPSQELTLVERLKMRFPTEDAVGEALLQVTSPQSPQQAPVLQQQASLGPQLSNMPNLTKSMRTVRRKHMSDFHMEPLMRKRKSAKAPELMPEDADLTEDGSLQSDNSSYRYSRKKLPVVHLEKLQTMTDSNASLEGEDGSKSPPPETPVKTRMEQLRKEEIINCICGYNEEDGLMIQCDICMCWQHGLCSKIEKEVDVPEKYMCPICKNPPRERHSRHYVHDQDWLKEGTLPSFSFRSKNVEVIKQREVSLKRTHELTAVLHQINQVIHSLRVKVNIAEAPDHPKLYLWAKSWEEADSEPSPQTFRPEVNSYEDQLKPDLLPLLHASSSPQQTHSARKDEKLGEGSVAGCTQQECEGSRADNWRNLPYPVPPSTLEEDMCSISSAEQEEDHRNRDLPSEDEEPTLEDVEASVDSTGPPEANVDEEKKQEEIKTEPMEEMVVEAVDVMESREEVVEATEDSTETKKPDDTSRMDGHILHQALTNGLSSMNTDEAVDSLQLPICQSELMRLASSMADNLEDPEPVKPQIPQMPVPEAPIDPYECKTRLLDHIENYHQQIDSRLTTIEAQIAALESMDPHSASDEAADYYPQTKQTVQMLLRDLLTIRRIGALN